MRLSFRKKLKKLIVFELFYLFFIIFGNFSNCKKILVAKIWSCWERKNPQDPRFTLRQGQSLKKHSSSNIFTQLLCSSRNFLSSRLPIKTNIEQGSNFPIQWPKEKETDPKNSWLLYYRSQHVRSLNWQPSSKQKAHYWAI